MEHRPVRPIPMRRRSGLRLWMILVLLYSIIVCGIMLFKALVYG
jgi:hypothetical protein